MGWGENKIARTSRLGLPLAPWAEVDKLEAKVASLEAEIGTYLDMLQAAHEELRIGRSDADEEVFALNAEVFKLRNKVDYWVDRAMTAEDDPNPYWSV